MKTNTLGSIPRLITGMLSVVGIGLYLLYMAPNARAQSQAPLILTNPASQIVFVGSNVSFQVSSTGMEPIRYQWRKNNVNIIAATNATLHLLGVTTDDSGTYVVTVIDAANATSSASATLTVLQPRLWVTGDNRSGQLGDGTLSDELTPVSTLGAALLMAGGASHSLFLKPDGTLWAMGNNASGQLGDGTTTQRVKPVPVRANVTGLAAGANHSLLIDSNRVLWAFGDNTFGQLGDGSVAQQSVPVSVYSNVVFVVAGAYHSLFITSDGTLFAMGANESGQLGDGTQKQRNLPVSVATNVTSAAAGGYHSLFLKSDGTLFAMGANDSGQLGDGTTTRRVVPVQVATGVSLVTAGAYHSLFVKSDGSLWAMGDNSYGQLGDGTLAEQNSPVPVANGVAGIASGFFHSLVVRADGTLWGMGANYAGQLGDGTLEPQPLPVSVAANVKSVAAGGTHTLFTANTLQPLAIVGDLVSRSAWVGDTVSFSVEVTQEPEVSYTWDWTRDGVKIAGANGPALTLTNVQLSDSGLYAVTITMGGATNVTSSAALLAVGPAGAPTVWADGQEVVGVVRKTLSTVVSLVDRLPNGYIFYTLDGTPPTYASAIYSGSFTISNTVVVRALWLSFDLTSVAEAPAATIEVLPFMVSPITRGGGTISIDPPQEYYGANSTVTLTAVPYDGWTFLYWQGDARGQADPLKVIVDGNKQIEAVFGTALQTNVIGNGSIQIIPPGFVPFGSSVRLMAIPAPGNYFIVWGNDITGRTNPVSFVVSAPAPLVSALFSPTIQSAPVVTTPPANVSAGPGKDVVLSVSALGGSLSYQWYFNGIAMPGMTNSTLPINALGPLQAGEYHVAVSGTGGTTVTAPAYVSMTDIALRPVVAVWGVPGMPFRVDYSDNVDIDGWTVLTNATLMSSRQDVIDFSSTSAQKRFYRVVINP